MIFILFTLLFKVNANLIDDDLKLIDSISNEWKEIIKDHFIPFQNGISPSLVNQTIEDGSHVLIQYINNTLTISDPIGYCFCNRTNYSSNIKFDFHLPRCQAMAQILQHTVKHITLPDFELVWSLDDLPTWITKQETHPKPGFGAIRCWSKGNLVLPFFGSHEIFNLERLNSFTSPKQFTPFKTRRNQVVFRGGVNRGCSFEKDTIINYGPKEFSNYNRSGKCGRTLLMEIAEKSLGLVNYTHKWITLDQQENTFRYILSVEGFGGWADRLIELIRRSMVVFDQEHPCEQWFEPMLKPYMHYIPIAHDFRNLIGRVKWANEHPNYVQNIIKHARQFSQRYLTSNGILAYMSTILKTYISFLKYQPKERTNAIRIEKLWDLDFQKSFCQH